MLFVVYIGASYNMQPFLTKICIHILQLQSSMGSSAPYFTKWFCHCHLTLTLKLVGVSHILYPLYQFHSIRPHFTNINYRRKMHKCLSHPYYLSNTTNCASHYNCSLQTNYNASEPSYTIQVRHTSPQLHLRLK